MIEKNIPLPGARTAGSSMGPVYRAMEVGDSVFLPNSDTRHANMLSAAATATKGAAKFSQRRVDGGKRLWRIA